MVTFKFKELSEGRSRLELIHILNTKDNNIKGHYEGWTWAMIDMDAKFNKPTWEKEPKLSVNIERVFNAPVTIMFELWTKPELMTRWFNSKGATQGDASCDLKVDGDYHLDYQDQETGEVTRCLGEYKEIIPNKKLVFTWVENTQYYESRVTVDFIDQGENKTLLKLCHDQFHSKENAKGYAEGWKYCFDSQETLLKQ